jgi:hypothetical protein
MENESKEIQDMSLHPSPSSSLPYAQMYQLTTPWDIFKTNNKLEVVVVHLENSEVVK